VISILVIVDACILVSYYFRLSEWNNVGWQWLSPAAEGCPCLHQLSEWLNPVGISVIDSRCLVCAFPCDVTECSFDILRVEALLVISPRTESGAEAMKTGLFRIKKPR